MHDLENDRGVFRIRFIGLIRSTCREKIAGEYVRLGSTHGVIGFDQAADGNVARRNRTAGCVDLSEVPSRKSVLAHLIKQIVLMEDRRKVDLLDFVEPFAVPNNDDGILAVAP